MVFFSINSGINPANRDREKLCSPSPPTAPGIRITYDGYTTNTWYKDSRPTNNVPCPPHNTSDQRLVNPFLYVITRPSNLPCLFGAIFFFSYRFRRCSKICGHCIVSGKKLNRLLVSKMIYSITELTIPILT
jgi:hypothetical protein